MDTTIHTIEPVTKKGEQLQILYGTENVKALSDRILFLHLILKEKCLNPA